MAEALDFVLIRPGGMAGAAWLLLPLPGGVWLGMVTGKAVADVAWYGAEASMRRGLARSLGTWAGPDQAHASPADALMRHDWLVTDRAVVSRWLAGYEAAWRSAGTASLADLFTLDASYLQSPYELPVSGLDSIARMWETEREGPDEVFTLTTDILAVDGPVAVVRAEVRYGDPPSQEYRDLWVIRLDDDGRCTWFEEWSYWPERPFAPHDDLP